MAGEVWRDVPGYEGRYRVSDQGSVLSLPRSRADGHFMSGRVLKAKLTYKGYLIVELFDGEGGSRNARVHRLVALAFLGPPPEGHVVRHLNGVPDDNRLVNLAWGTSAENSRDAIEHGTHSQASRTHCRRGHLYTEANLRITSRGHRCCRTCERAQEQRRRERRSAQEMTDRS